MSASRSPTAVFSHPSYNGYPTRTGQSAEESLAEHSINQSIHVPIDSLFAR